VRLAALDLEGSQGCIGDLGSESVISENLWFSSNSWVSHFCLNVTFYVNSVEFVILDAHGEFLNVVNSIPGPFLRKLSNFSDSGEKTRYSLNHRF